VAPALEYVPAAHVAGHATVAPVVVPKQPALSLVHALAPPVE